MHTTQATIKLEPAHTSQYGTPSPAALVTGLTPRDAMAKAYRLAAATEELSGGWGWVVVVERQGNATVRVSLELLAADEREVTAAQKIMARAARKA